MSTPDPIDDVPEPLAVTAELDPQGPDVVVPADAEPAIFDAAPSEPPDDPVAAALGRLEAQLAESHRLIERQADVAARLHAENQELRGGELRRAQQGLVFGVLRVHDDVLRMAAATGDPAGARDLQLVADALVDALGRSGVEPTTVLAGDPFDAKQHKVARIDPSPDPAADRTVAEVVRAGFAWAGGDLIRTAEVAVFKHAPAPAPEPAAAAEPAQPFST